MTINGNHFIQTDNREEAVMSINGYLYRRATAEEILPGYEHRTS